MSFIIPITLAQTRLNAKKNKSKKCKKENLPRSLFHTIMEIEEIKSKKKVQKLILNLQLLM